MTPLHKKGRKHVKQNYRSVSILPILSKIYERDMFQKMSSLFADIFSKHQCGLRKGFSGQQCLLTLLEKWKNAVDKGKIVGTLLTNLSKAFYPVQCQSHKMFNHFVKLALKGLTMNFLL